MKPNILDLVHIYVCVKGGKILGSALYFATCINDQSKKVWDFLLKSKYHVLMISNDFNTIVEREEGRNLKCVRVDNDGKYRGPFE